MPASADVFTAHPTGLTVAVRAVPKSSRDAILGVVTTPDGPALKIAVRAAPDKGAANAAVIAVMAKEFGVPKSAVSLLGGAASRRKRLHVAGDPDLLMRRARALAPSSGERP